MLTMLVWLIIFFFLISQLFFLSHTLTKHFYLFFLLLSKSKSVSIRFLIWFFLPGTVVHELAHLVAAKLLRVKIGGLSFLPEVKDNNKGISLGRLKMAKTDPLRYSLIGLAPILAGIAVVVALIYYFLLPLLEKTFSLPFQPNHYQTYIINTLLILFLGLILFSISNTMFSSRSDLKTILFPIMIILLISGVFVLGGFKLSLPPKTVLSLIRFLKIINLALSITIVVDLCFLVLVKGFIKRLHKA